MPFNISIPRQQLFTPAQSQHRFEYVDRADASSGNDALSRFEWATTWGKACGGWMVFEDSGTLDDWLLNG